MTTTFKFGDPQIIVDDPKFGELFFTKQLSSADVRLNQAVQEQIRNGEVSKTFLNGVRGLPFYYGLTCPTPDSSSISFERHFNPQLARDSEYFKALHGLISCVENNLTTTDSSSSSEAPCRTEMRALRLAVFNNELLYHNVNKRFYMSLLQYKRGEAPF